MSVPPAGNRQVSLRGSSAREITRDALLQKVSEERQLRSHLRRAAAAALSIQKLLGRYNFLDELSTLDPELYRNLMQLKHYDGNVEDLCLDFTVTEELGGKRIVHELKPGGRSISVTNENKLHYVHAMADFKLNRQILPFANAFYRGLSDLISPSWLSLFNANEFNQLLSGGLQDFDVDDLRNNTKYTGGYTESSRTVKLFWELPTYKRSSTLRSKLLYAISSNAGFELS
nr:unnamed protein product [Digitaria exilis]